MALDDYREDMAACVRCSSCKWVPFNQMRSARFSHNCPSINRFNFHSHSGSGRMNMGLSIMEGRSELTERVSEVIYACQLCGACDTTCKTYREIIDLTEVLLELRAGCVEEGQLLLEHMAVIDSLKQENNMLGEPKAERGAWAEGLDLKDINREQVEVMLHVGCRFSYDQELWPALRASVSLLQRAGVEVGIAGAEESCCGGRAYELGYRGEARNFAEDMQARVKASGASVILTPCSDGFAAFRHLYPRMGVELSAEPLHLTQLLDRLVRQGRLRLRHDVPLKVTYHDPCHLGRMGEPWLPEWTGGQAPALALSEPHRQAGGSTRSRGGCSRPSPDWSCARWSASVSGPGAAGRAEALSTPSPSSPPGPRRNGSPRPSPPGRRPWSPPAPGASGSSATRWRRIITT